MIDPSNDLHDWWLLSRNMSLAISNAADDLKRCLKAGRSHSFLFLGSQKEDELLKFLKSIIERSSFPEKHPPFKAIFGITTTVKYPGPVEAAALIDLARARLFLGEDMEGEAGVGRQKLSRPNLGDSVISHSPVSPVETGT